MVVVALEGLEKFVLVGADIAVSTGGNNPYIEQLDMGMLQKLFVRAAGRLVSRVNSHESMRDHHHRSR